MTIHLYGIPNCDTVKKARSWLDARGLEYSFHDYKKEGANAGKIAAWIDAAGLEAVLNRRGATFRKLPDSDKAKADHSHTAVALLVQNPSMIKRPIVDHPGGVLVGFSPDEWDTAL